MSIELKIPDVGESIQEVQIDKWLKQEGDAVEEDEDVVQLETDKASMELAAPAAGVIAKIVKQEGESVSVGEVIALIDETDGKPKQEKEKRSDENGSAESREKKGQPKDIGAESEEQAGDNKGDPDDSTTDDETSRETSEVDEKETDSTSAEQDEDEQTVLATPAGRRALREHGLSADEVEPAGERIRPDDVDRHRHEINKQTESDSQEVWEAEPAVSEDADSGLEEVVPMSLIRRRIAQTLVEAQQQAALLTTFNEIDMSEVIELRQEYQEQFEDEYGMRLGYMPFFVKAVIDALRHFPELNAEIRDDKIAYRDYYHIGIAIGSDKGLVVPVMRFAERLSFAEIEEAIGDFARRAADNKLEPDDLAGGTFTVTNGGVYGSLLSTPIVNPPQSGVLGMHAIQDRPVAREGRVVIRPMMYVALTYDHRIVDGREAVSFLKRVAEAIEEPARMLIEV